MAADVTVHLTILDLPEIEALLEEALAAVPAWEQAALRERLQRIITRAEEDRRHRGRG